MNRVGVKMTFSRKLNTISKKEGESYKILLEEVDSNFPVGKDGKIEWD